MKILLPFFLLVFVFILEPLRLAADELPKSLVVMLDGVRSDALRMAKTPAIDSLQTGSWAPGYKGAWTFAAHTIKDAPANSAPNHTAITTGVSAAKSRVMDNKFFEDYNKLNASAAYKHYLSRIEWRYPEKSTVFLYNWKPDALLMSENNRCDLSLQGGDSTSAARATGILIGGFESENWKMGTDVDALCLYIDLPDAAGHQRGFSPPGTGHDGYIKSIETCDEWIGHMLTAIKNRKTFAGENWQIIICSDHGGWIGSHGFARADTFTVPLIVSSKSVVSGVISGQPCTTDVAVTVLKHFDFDIEQLREYCLIDGSPRGLEPVAKPQDRTLEDGLLVYLPFDGNLENKGNGKIQAENRGATIGTTGGKNGAYLVLRPGETPQFVTLGHSETMQFGGKTGFSIAFWLRMPRPQTGDPVLFGNKDWKDGRNVGVNLFASKEGNGNNIGLNLADESRNRVDVKQFYAAPNEWYFCAATVDRSGNATLYLGSPNGKLFFGSETLVGENVGKSGSMTGSIDSPLPWNIGQDGTGTYASQLDADLDELRIWNRALTLEEIDALYCPTRQTGK